MKKLKPAICYECATKILPMAIFYLISYGIYALIFLIITLCAGPNNVGVSGIESSSAVFVGVMGAISFREDFKALLQNGYPRRAIFLATVCMFAVMAGVMAAIDTTVCGLLGRIFPNFRTLFGMFYGDSPWILHWLWRGALYLLVCSLSYLAILVVHKVGKTTALLISVALAGGVLVIIAVFRFVLTPETVGKIGRFALGAMGFLQDGSQNLLLPVLTFFALGAALGACSYAILRRTELR